LYCDLIGAIDRDGKGVNPPQFRLLRVWQPGEKKERGGAPNVLITKLIDSWHDKVAKGEERAHRPSNTLELMRGTNIMIGGERRRGSSPSSYRPEGEPVSR